MAKYIWLFYVSKTFEFMDTFIMVLKKNNHQISFLHVYHHFSIFMIWWFVTFTVPNGESYFSAALNSRKFISIPFFTPFYAFFFYELNLILNHVLTFIYSSMS